MNRLAPAPAFLAGVALGLLAGVLAAPAVWAVGYALLHRSRQDGSH